MRVSKSQLTPISSAIIFTIYPLKVISIDGRIGRQDLYSTVAEVAHTARPSLWKPQTRIGLHVIIAEVWCYRISSFPT